MKVVSLFLAALMAIAVPAHAQRFALRSPQLREGGVMPQEQVFDGSGCRGKNISPQLQWGAPPRGTQSLAVTVYDPDAPTGKGWWHWVIFNIPPSASGLAKDAGNPSGGKAPAGSVQTRNDFGQPGYGGACPPAGPPHRYVFTVYALKAAKAPFDAKASAAEVASYLQSQALSSASLTVSYGR